MNFSAALRRHIWRWSLKGLANVKIHKREYSSLLVFLAFHLVLGQNRLVSSIHVEYEERKRVGSDSFGSYFPKPKGTELLGAPV